MFDQTVVGGSSGAIRVATKQAANTVAFSNQVVAESPQFAEDDVELGVYGLDGSWTNSDTSARNAVRRRLRRRAWRYFAKRILGSIRA